ncbi:MAG: hypothetical protein ACOC9J_02515 [Persicimonas sp.]
MSPKDPNNPPPGTDGWVDRRKEPTRQPRPVDFTEPRRSQPDLSPPEHYPLERTAQASQRVNADPEEVDRGKPMAIFAHLSILFGLPVFLIPLIQRNNAFSLHHAKAAAVIYGLFMLAGFISLVTCGLGMPLAMLCYIPALIAIVRAARGDDAGTWGMGEVGENVFGSVEVKGSRD